VTQAGPTTRTGGDVDRDGRGSALCGRPQLAVKLGADLPSAGGGVGQTSALCQKSLVVFVTLHELRC
jgi:hypothetical protein